MKERLKILRKNLGLSQKAFGEKIGVTDVAISYMESGRTAISDQNVYLICLTFGVREEWLRTGEGEIMNIETELSKYEARLLDIFRRLSPTAQDIFLSYGDVLINNELILKQKSEQSTKQNGAEKVG